MELSNYRIKKVTKIDGDVSYYPQKKFLWLFWLPLHEFGCVYTDFEYANNAIIQDYIKTREIEVEYMPPQRVDTPKTVLSTPNPPQM